MRFKTNFLLAILAAIFIFGGCSKEVDEYNKPAVYWYGMIIESIADADLEKADSYYSSLQGEHIGSPLLPEATLILSIAHMHYEEYVLSEHFSNEYVKRYANTNEKEFAEFMKIKAKYLALPNPRRDQVLIQEALKEGALFKINYPRSMYYPVVDTMMTNLRMAEAVLNEMIVDLYIRLDKPKSAAYYKDIKPQTWIDWNEIERANTAWYREWFEGDGTESWYAFMIPDTQSVVSRNTVQEEVVDGEVAGVAAATAVAQNTKIQEEQLAKIQELRDEGVLSEEEYKELKEEILSTTEEVAPNEAVAEEPSPVEEVAPEEVAEEPFAEEPAPTDEPYYESENITQKTKKQEVEMKKAQDLYDSGVLTEKEFKELQEEILN